MLAHVTAMSTTLFRTQVPKKRLKSAERVLGRLGLDPGGAFNLLLAQIEINGGLPFAVSTRPQRVLQAEEQADEWNHAFGNY
jgi:addiction module RelB/DinJ family antitoxin